MPRMKRLALPIPALLALALLACSTSPGPSVATATPPMVPLPSFAPMATSATATIQPTAAATATRTPLPPTVAPWPTSTPPVGCAPAEIADLLARLFAAHSRGDLTAVRAFFPQQDSPPSGPDGVNTHFQWFSVTDFAPQQGRRHFSARSREELWAYLAARHAQRERLQLDELTINNHTPDGVAAIGYLLTRESDDLPPHSLSGKGAVNCRDRTIIVWSMGTTPVPPRVTPGAATLTGTNP